MKLTLLETVIIFQIEDLLDDILQDTILIDWDRWRFGMIWEGVVKGWFKLDNVKYRMDLSESRWEMEDESI